jgi:hypothetical protein
MFEGTREEERRGRERREEEGRGEKRRQKPRRAWLEVSRVGS